MAEDDGRPTERLAVLVFKDNLAARTFEIPLRWISRLGWLLSCCVLITVASTIFAVRYYYAAHQASPYRVQALERELEDLKAKQVASETAAKAEPAPVASASPALVEGAQTTMPSVPASGVLFTALPQGAADVIPDPASLPFNLHQPQVFWKGNTLKVRFAIQYIKGDGGNQQGRIVILARGTGAFLSYPDSLFSLSGNGILIDPSRGEYFSVSRFRQVDADFGPVANHQAIKEVEILLFNTSGKVILAQKLVPAARAPAPKPPVAEEAEGTP